MKMRKSIALFLAAVAMLSAAGCGGSSNKEVEGKINLSVSDWPDETNQKGLEKKNKMRDDFMAQNTDINIIGDTYKWDSKTFTMKAAAGQLPTMYWTRFTEIQPNIRGGYAADITEQFKASGYFEAMNPQLVDLVTGEDGKIYGIPTDAYILGLYMNTDILKQAGLVNADGSAKYPQTWQEVAEFSQTIKEKTGKAGFIIPTTNNCGGWQFLNIAWAFGVEDFCVQREDGTWEAAFDNQAARDALQYLKDLKWKYNALIDDTVISQDDMYKYFGSGQAAMMMREPTFSAYSWGLDNNILACTNMPAGPAGRFTQMGGNLWQFVPTATPEQIEAGIKWLKYTGLSFEMTDEEIANYKTTLENNVENHGVVLEREAYNVWVNEDLLAKKSALRAEYQNVDMSNYETYFDMEPTVKLEPAACAQELYSIMDGCVQEVITNENADVDKLISEAAKDYQANHLDKM